jgi:hypothetical protein
MKPTYVGEVIRGNTSELSLKKFRPFEAIKIFCSETINANDV